MALRRGVFGGRADLALGRLGIGEECVAHFARNDNEYARRGLAMVSRVPRSRRDPIWHSEALARLIHEPAEVSDLG